jgi:hypothetical protein
MEIIGQRGYVGKKTINSSTQFNRQIEVERDEDVDAAITKKKGPAPKPVETTAKPQFNSLFEAE